MLLPHSLKVLSLNNLLEKAHALMNQDAGAALTLAQEAVTQARSTAAPQLLAKALRARAMAQGSTGNMSSPFFGVITSPSPLAALPPAKLGSFAFKSVSSAV